VLTSTQWECLLAATHGNAHAFHGKTTASLVRLGLLRYQAGRGLVTTFVGRARLHLKGYPPGSIGLVGADAGVQVPNA
jgi:hypothetical protein